MIAGIILGIFIVLGASWYANHTIIVIENTSQMGQVTQSWENLESKGD